MARLIDKDSLIHDLCAGLCGAYDQCKKWCSTITVINMQPVIYAKAEFHGRWVEPIPDSGLLRCSVCEESIIAPLLWNGEKLPYDKYCRYCGAKMDGGEDDGS